VTVRHLVLVLGDQLDGSSAAFDGFDPGQDAVLMIEARHEAAYVPQHKRRLAFFFAAMRHFAQAQRGAGRRVHYAALDDPDNRGTFAEEIVRWAQALDPQQIVVLEPGDWRVRRELESRKVELREDRHFLCDRQTFSEFVNSHHHPVLETFYRFMRRRLDVLIQPDNQPVGGVWNFDHENRASFGRKGPPPIPAPTRFRPDGITRSAIDLVQRAFPTNPGRLDDFDLAVTREQALNLLQDFLTHRLRDFGAYQDAMHTGQAFLFHSQISSALNLHLLHPREVIDAALSVSAPLNAVEGFVRQIIGWREVRARHLLALHAGLCQSQRAPGRLAHAALLLDG
jgi:deoxyribodipyrimidine photolyase-related protein